MNYKNAEAEYKHAEEKYIQAQMYLLATLDTYCKYANKELSDDELAGENITFFKNIIQEPKFKECILKHKKFFNNIIKFAEINKIKL
ncbi:hypothetical protein [Helicobacter ailurogastricus]|uniref:hypothetical protein n=1 Tax=Helicobacter ailurogastricus TaxID=1578720 RepID=UPI000AD2E920|nr:hypothetical protein [Helicobacter ailurogastricus]BDQ29845.1 hypothetical protein ASB7_16820 [Helicobacter ailurogastricus]